MDIFSPHSGVNHDGLEIIAKKDHELFLGQRRRPHKGMHLWALDPLAGTMYPVKIEISTTLKIAGLGSKDTHEKKNSRAYTNPNHYMLWALNAENAIRKFRTAFKIPKDGDISKMML